MAESHDDRKICFAAQPGDEVQSGFRNLKNKTLDIADNLIFNQLRGITPKMVFQYIATGLIGMQAFRGGLASVALGGQYTTRLQSSGQQSSTRQAANSRFLSRCPVLSGLVYGGVIWFPEFHRLVILRSAESKERDHDCFKSKWCAGSALLYWITHLTSRAAIFERTDTT